MSRRIWKFPLEVTDVQSVPLGASDRVLCAQTQNGIPTLWAIVNSEIPPLESRKVAIVGTGNSVPTNAGEYVGSCQCGLFVWHVFVEAGAQT